MTRRTRQPTAVVEEDPVTGPHWVLRLPVREKYDLVTAARILGVSTMTVRRRIDTGKLRTDARDKVYHASITALIQHEERRELGRRYRQQLIKRIQVDFEVEVPDVSLE